MTELTKIGAVLGSLFILTVIWKIYQVEWIKRNQDWIHKIGLVFWALLTAWIAYSWLGITWTSLVTGLISGVLFWNMDIIINLMRINKFVDYGDKSGMDAIKFRWRLLLLIVLVGVLILIQIL